MLFSDFYRSKDKKYYKIWTKKTVFIYILGFIFMVFFGQTLIYAIIMWFNFVVGSVFGQNHLLNWIILRAKCAHISIQKLS